MSTATASIQRIGVIGAGAWGTALAQLCATAGRDVRLWAFEAEVAKAIGETRENAAFLPGVALAPTIEPVSDLAAIAEMDAYLAVTPAQFARATLKQFAPMMKTGSPLVMCAKGVEQGSLALMSEVAEQIAPESPLAVLSGPGFAKDVVRGLPTAITLAARDREAGQALVAAIGLPTFRPYLTDDLIGTEIGGAIKNVIAIACGVCEGRNLGDSARAALITRGFAEMSRLGRAMGARQETLNGLCGLGDLVLTCSSRSSRNMALGCALGEGLSLPEAMAGRLSVAEGAASAPAVVALAQRERVEMPICAAVASLLAGSLNVDQAIMGLLARPFRAEGE
ncbi:MAG: NAD(P)H-dependent glycerol-3-phosphate dehydrogenase [Caulobacterales bacterium]